VITHGSRILATGFHRRAGEAHGEVEALRAAGEAARGGTLYVTFEPCNHHGRTPPCTEAILAAGIHRVVVGCRDPHPHVPGAIERLRSEGVEVEVGVCEDEAEALIADFAKHISTGLPYVVLKAAVTLDGKLATGTGDSKWITGEGARTQAHRLRDQADAVLVGVGTVLRDDPELTVRHVDGVHPMRIVVDTNLRTPPWAKVVTAPSSRPTRIFHAPDVPEATRVPLRNAGCDLIEISRTSIGKLDIFEIVKRVGKLDVVRLLVEGGGAIHGSLLDTGLADHASIFVAPRIVGDHSAPSLARGRATATIAEAWRIPAPRIEVLGVDVWIDGRLAHGS
jgi:diaminohydroxyphosphoribosylaminopyrimidine deaminase/5-amino-6-(5-phosphoribosylamino)uracil reductase